MSPSGKERKCSAAIRFPNKSCVLDQIDELKSKGIKMRFALLLTLVTGCMLATLMREAAADGIQTTAVRALIPLLLSQTEPNEKYPLDQQMKVLVKDIASENYRKLVTEKMLQTDLAAEWQRVATPDNADVFLEKHGGETKVMADPELKAAYERRVKIRDDFLNLMRDGYKRYNIVPPFDKGAVAELAGTKTIATAAVSQTIETVLPAPGADRYWPRFRGPSGQGETSAKKLPITWDKSGDHIVWHLPIPGFGNSSPIIWGNHLFLTSSTEDGQERFVHAIDRSTGKFLWSRTIPPKPPEPAVRNKNGYATSTPVTDGERVVAFFGSCGLVCYDFEGNLQWNYDNVKIESMHGTGSSPLIYQDLVILAQDQNRADSIFLALDKRTGQVRWQANRPKAMTWSSPVIVHSGDRDELIMAGGKNVVGYNPLDGEVLWTLTGTTVEVVPTVVVAPHLIISASGRNGPTIGLRPGGSGDVSNTHLAWRTVRGGPHVPSPILVGGRLYVINDTGIATCLNAETGELVYQSRIEDTFSASPVSAGDLMYFASETGITYVVRASDKLDIVAKNDLGAPILASPAVVDERLYIRTKEELFCIGEQK